MLTGTQFHIICLLFHCKSEWLEQGALMTVVTKWLLAAHTAAAPAILFLLYFRIGNSDGAKASNHRLWFLSQPSLICVLDLFVVFDIPLWIVGRIKLFLLAFRNLEIWFRWDSLERSVA